MLQRLRALRWASWCQALCAAAAGATEDCVAWLVLELEGTGLLVERVRGVPTEFIKVYHLWPGAAAFFFLIQFQQRRRRRQYGRARAL